MKKTFSLKKFIKTPKGQLTAVLLILLIVSELFKFDLHSLYVVGYSLLTAIVIDVLVGIKQKRKSLLPDGGIITALIIGLILSSFTPWYLVVFTTGIAVISKHVIKTKRKPIFNPAAFGLLISSLIFHTGQSWWGGLTLVSPYLIVVLVMTGYWIVSRVNKFPLVFTYLGITFGFFLIATYFFPSSTISDSYLNPFVNSTLFLSFFMITDPPTSPAKYSEQVIFAIFASVVSLILYVTIGGLVYLYIGVLFSNLWKYYVSVLNEKVFPKKTSRKNQMRRRQA